MIIDSLKGFKEARDNILDAYLSPLIIKIEVNDIATAENKQTVKRRVIIEYLVQKDNDR